MHKIQVLKSLALIACLFTSANTFAVDPQASTPTNPSAEATAQQEQHALMLQKMHEQQVKMQQAQAQVTRERDAQRLKAEIQK